MFNFVINQDSFYTLYGILPIFAQKRIALSIPLIKILLKLFIPQHALSKKNKKKEY